MLRPSAAARTCATGAANGRRRGRGRRQPCWHSRCRPFARKHHARSIVPPVPRLSGRTARRPSRVPPREWPRRPRRDDPVLIPSSTPDLP
ncbi:hypothetical protein CFB89_08095 [Burkholderia sp. AU16741]|nr:hypothetical protein CFB89_08095 [Burkholderia sp. AU16741]